ncbi:relaxase domain-containing protein [Streptomyces sp. NPDC015242]|uniref:relaxase domain-containing protein n=1 Tax=Streptomyces sp. NPDC015242 TaxID=3364951 RepID=UPI0036FBA045
MRRLARDKPLAWLEESIAQQGWRQAEGPGQGQASGRGVRHYEPGPTESRPLLHSHSVVSVRARRPHDGKWGNLSADSLVSNIVAADTLYTLYFLHDLSARLGWAWEPRQVTPGRWQVTEGWAPAMRSHPPAPLMYRYAAMKTLMPRGCCGCVTT